jgi:hypothetical protein
MAEPIRPRPEERREMPEEHREPREVTGIERRGYERPVERPVERPAERVVQREPEMYPGAAGFERMDLVRWGPIVAGLVTTFATFLLLSVLGLAIGISGVEPGAPAPTAAEVATPSAIWAAVSMIIALFLGGYVASRTAGISGSFVAAINGAMVWATWLTLLLIIAALGAVGVIGGAALTIPGITPGAVQAATSALWWTFIALLVGLAAAIAGGLVGRHAAPEPGQYEERFGQR